MSNRAVPPFCAGSVSDGSRESSHAGWAHRATLRTEQIRKSAWVALGAPRGQMQGDATQSMPLSIGEERQRRRRPRAAHASG